jgi:hypothetical protein
MGIFNNGVYNIGSNQGFGLFLKMILSSPFIKNSDFVAAVPKPGTGIIQGI